MPGPDFFRRFGLFVVEEFFDDDLCTEIRASMTPASRPSGALRQAEARLVDVRPDVARHFELTLASCEMPRLIRDATGDVHPVAREAGVPGMPGRVSAVIFLNPLADDPGDGVYGGGALTFYGLFHDPIGSKLGFPLEATAGLLIAFRADMLHSVAPITHGERFTIATGFC